MKMTYSKPQAQVINLYAEEFRPRRQWATLPQMVLAWALCLLLLGAIVAHGAALHLAIFPGSEMRFGFGVAVGFPALTAAVAFDVRNKVQGKPSVIGAMTRRFAKDKPNPVSTTD